jgi:hypothetical protein
LNPEERHKTLSVPDTAQPTFEFSKVTFCVPSLAAWQGFAVLRPKAVWLAGFIMCLGWSTASPASLTWLESKTDAVSAAKSQGKLVLLLAGREDTCGNCRYMLNTVCESLSPPVKELIQDRYVPWYCDMDTNADWQPYALGLGTFTLPLICCIDPNTTNQYLDRTTGTQTAQDFYDRLLAAARTNGPRIQVSLTHGLVSLMITNLTVGITNRVERSFDPSDPGGWSVVSTFVSPATATNWTEVYDPGCPKAFYRISSVVSGK